MQQKVTGKHHHALLTVWNGEQNKQTNHNNIEPKQQDGIYHYSREFKDEKQGYLPTMKVENDMASRMIHNIRNPNVGEKRLASLFQQEINRQLRN